MDCNEIVVGEDFSKKSSFSGYRITKTNSKDSCNVKKELRPDLSSSSDDEEKDEVSDEEVSLSVKRKKESHTATSVDEVASVEMAMEFEESITRDDGPSASKEDAEVSNKRRNNVWGNVLMEQSLTDTIYEVGVERNRGAGSREVETYEYWLKNRPTPNKHRTDNPSENSRKRKRSSAFNYQKDEPDEKFAKRLARRLNEPKHILIGNVVKRIGKKLATEILHNVEKIEASGGMMTLDRSRRRTPGGVFLHLLKSHPSVSKEELNAVFAEDKRLVEEHRNRRKFKNLTRRRFVPKEMEIVPKEVENVAGPDSTVAGPDSTVAGPDRTVAGPDSIVAGPDSIVAGPDNTVAGPDNTVAGPDNTVA